MWKGNMARIILTLSLAVTALVTIEYTATAQAQSQAQCPDQITDSISASQVAACLRDLRNTSNAIQSSASQEPQVVTCKISGRRPQAGLWTFSFGNMSCSKPLTDFEVLSGWVTESDLCGGLDNYAIGLSPPSITIAGFKQCDTQESKLSVSFLVRAKK